MRASVGTAVAELEIIKLNLLKVFSFISTPKMITKEERSNNLMLLYEATIMLPILEISIREAIKLLTVPKV